MIDVHHMDTDDFLGLALRNPVNARHRRRIVRARAAGCVDRLGLPGADRVERADRRAVDYGISDYDIFYFDPDISWQAEDAVIRQLQDRLAHLGVTIEARNQARVHLWYPEKHGLPYPALRCSTEGIDRFLTRNTQVGIRRTRMTVTTSTRRTASTTSPA